MYILSVTVRHNWSDTSKDHRIEFYIILFTCTVQPVSVVSFFRHSVLRWIVHNNRYDLLQLCGIFNLDILITKKGNDQSNESLGI